MNALSEYIRNIVAFSEIKHQKVQNILREKCNIKDFILQPLIQAIDFSLATFRAIPASCTTWTTSFRFL